MQSNNKFIDPDKIDRDQLSSYERFQLEKYGNILKNTDGPLSKFYSGDRLSTGEENYIFSSQNEKQ